MSSDDLALESGQGRRCLVAGASGLVGSELLKILLADAQVSLVTVVTRRPLGLTHGKLQEVIVDFSALDRLTLPSHDVAFCALGTTIKKAGSQQAFRAVDELAVIDFAKAAKRVGCRRFLVVSGAGADAKSMFLYSRVKAQMEAGVQAVGIESTCVLRPSLLLGDRQEHRTAEKMMVHLEPVMSLLMQGPLAKQRPVHASQVAQCLWQQALASRPGFHIISNQQILATS